MAVFVGEIGKKIEITFGVNLTGASVVYKVKKPSGASGPWTAIVDNAALGITSFTTVDATNLDEPGTYQITPEVSFTDPTRRYYGTIVEFPVKNLYT